MASWETASPRRPRLHAQAYNPATFMRTLALPKEVEHWSLTTLPEKLVRIGAKVVRHGRYVTFQLAAEKSLFPRRRRGDMISTNLEVIRGMWA